MDITSIMIEVLRQKKEITPLEQDILDTWDELQKTPFDRAAAELQAKKNNAKYPAMYGAIMALPNTTSIPWEQTTDQDVWSCLSYQLGFLAGNKLELTWYGKDEPIQVEPRLLIENGLLSNTAAAPDTENMLIHGDNPLALKALESQYAGQVKCIYIETSCETGNPFMCTFKFFSYNQIISRKGVHLKVIKIYDFLQETKKFWQQEAQFEPPVARTL